MNADLLQLVYDHDELAELDPAARRLALRTLLAEEARPDLPAAVRQLADEIDGFGPISDAMRAAGVTDILINGPYEVWIEVDGSIELADVRFIDHEHLRAWCERVVSAAGGRIDSSWPISDVRLADGSRFHAVLPPVAPGGPLVSIRRSPPRPRSLDDLCSLGFVSPPDRALLRKLVTVGRSIAISGPTGTGKTTLLNALLLEVSSRERIVVIEELPELRLDGTGAVSLVARAPNPEGRGEVRLEALVRASLRMRPDRIVIGEVRGPEALPALQAMTTGHAGAMLSVHARSASHVPSRIGRPGDGRARCSLGNDPRAQRCGCARCGGPYRTPIGTTRHRRDRSACVMDLVRAFDELAAVLDVEPSIRSALTVWHENVIDRRDAEVLRATARRIRLGAPIDIALAPLLAAAGSDARPLLDAVRSHSTTGASLATTVRAIARSIEGRRALAHDGRAAGAAAKLSGRMLALFAGSSLLLAPMARGMSPGTAAATIAAASALVWVGVRWMRRLSPRPPTADDPVASHAETFAGLIRAGVQPPAALDLIGSTADLARARRLVALGVPWPDAIASAGGHEHARLAQILRRGDRLGVPVADALMALAADIRERSRRSFEIEARRAPVLLVLPLALCLLPAFGIVVIVPLLRGLSV